MHKRSCVLIVCCVSSYQCGLSPLYMCCLSRPQQRDHEHSSQGETGVPGPHRYMPHPGFHDVSCARLAMGWCCLAVERLTSMGDLARMRASANPFLAFASEAEREV